MRPLLLGSILCVCTHYFHAIWHCLFEILKIQLAQLWYACMGLPLRVWSHVSITLFYRPLGQLVIPQMVFVYNVHCWRLYWSKDLLKISAGIMFFERLCTEGALQLHKFLIFDHLQKFHESKPGSSPFDRTADTAGYNAQPLKSIQNLCSP
jgi:hypothetical protein